jgi:hypothetical protein
MCPANEHDSPVVVDAIESESDLQSGGCQKVVKMQPDRHGSEEGLAGVEAPRMPYVWSPLCNAADLATLQRRASRLSNMIRKWPSRKAVFHQLPLRACQSQSRVPAPRVRLVSSCMVCAHSNYPGPPPMHPCSSVFRIAKRKSQTCINRELPLNCFCFIPRHNEHSGSSNARSCWTEEVLLHK